MFFLHNKCKGTAGMVAKSFLRIYRGCSGTTRALNILAVLFFFLSLVTVSFAGNGVKTPQELKKQWGIEITSVRMAVDGHMVDFRYRVLDPARAATLFVRKNKPYLLDQASQKVLGVPNLGKVGPLRTSNPPKKGRIYWMFFANAGGLVKPGSKVTVIIGDFRVEDVVVQ